MNQVQHKLWTGTLVPALVAAGALSEPGAEGGWGRRAICLWHSVLRLQASDGFRGQGLTS